MTNVRGLKTRPRADVYLINTKICVAVETYGKDHMYQESLPLMKHVLYFLGWSYRQVPQCLKYVLLA